jgi:alkanesulfonate monooxygenase SsuD/methylene tetrahydromethanopterin reductase-like flavin-dependent oxidoreductase (luciferase family)
MRHIGLFLEELRTGATDAEFFRELIQTADAVEEWGLDGVWLGEIHFLPSRSVLSSPLVTAAALVTRTRRICVGTAVHVIPLRNPLGVAEDVATLDHLSGGRFEFGIGRSGSPRAYDLLGIPYAESQGRLFEALEVMREAWKGKTFSFRGTYFDVADATVAPRPLQTPHPPVRIAALNPGSFVRAAELGLHIFVGLRGTDISVLRGHIERYQETWRAAAHPGEGSVYLRIPLFAGPTDTAAIEASRESIAYYFRRQSEMARTGTGSGTRTTGERLAQADELAGLSYDHILRERVVVGSAATLVARLSELSRELHLDGIIVEPNAGGMIPLEPMMQSLRILAEEVAPKLR